MTISAAVDPALLERMLVWTGDLPVATHHAADGLFIGSACRHDGLPRDPEADLLVGLGTMFWFWFDDRSDHFLVDPATWDVLLSADPTAVSVDSAGSWAPELRFFLRLSEAVRRRALDDTEHRWWVDRSVDVFRSMHVEQRLSRAGGVPSYAESLEAGADSTALTSILAAANVAHAMPRAARGADQVLARVERYFCLSQRLLNDLNSAEKERREGPAGRVSNIVLLLEASMSPSRARAFAEAERRAYERLMLEAITSLGPDDEFGRLIHHCMHNIRRWYAAEPVRYETEGAAP